MINFVEMFVQNRETKKCYIFINRVLKHLFKNCVRKIVST